MARIQAIKICPSYSYTVCFTMFAWELSTLTKDNFAAKTNLAVGSTEFCQCEFDERDICEGLSGGGGVTGAMVARAPKPKEGI